MGVADRSGRQRPTPFATPGQKNGIQLGQVRRGHRREPQMTDARHDPLDQEHSITGRSRGSQLALGSVDPLLEELADGEPPGMSKLPRLDAPERLGQSRLRLPPGAKPGEPLLPLLSGLIPAQVQHVAVVGAPLDDASPHGLLPATD